MNNKNALKIKILFFIYFMYEKILFLENNVLGNFTYAFKFPS